MVTYPKQDNPMSGLLKIRGRWQACYCDNGKRRTKSLGDADAEEARRRRDVFYAQLRAGGAVEAKLGRPRGATRKETPYIYANKRWSVVVRGKFVGGFDDLDEAVAARDEYQKGGEA